MIKNAKQNLSFIPIMIVILSTVFITSYYSINNKQSTELPERNAKYYQALITSGMAQVSNSRVVTDKDIDTQLIATTTQGTFRLYESRNWNTNDYGKLFVVRES